MKISLKLVILIAFIIGSQCLHAQNWSFPICNDLTVTNIEETQDNPNEILITVYNECDTCHTHAYTGLRLYRNEELLAEEDELYIKPSPENNDNFEYTLIKMSEFEITNDLRIEMVGVCDSIPLSPDIVNGQISTHLDELNIKVFPNPSYEIINIKADDLIKIENVRLVNSQGQLVIERQNATSELNVSRLPNGIYILEINTNKGIFKKQIVIN